MSAKNAYLEIVGPDGENRGPVALQLPRVSVGRSTPASRPDVCLDPDPNQWVGRFHCLLESEVGAWWVTDNATVNGTYIRSGSADAVRISGRHRLRSGDVIQILGDIDADGPHYWRLTFCDPFATRQATSPDAPAVPPAACVRYDWAQARLFRYEGPTRAEIALAPKGHRLVRYMVKKSEENGGVPVACMHDELIRAVWGDESGWELGRAYTRENLRDLIADLRQRLEPDPAQPRIIQAVTGIGYRLITCPQLPSLPASVAAAGGDNALKG